MGLRVAFHRDNDVELGRARLRRSLRQPVPCSLKRCDIQACWPCGVEQVAHLKKGFSVPPSVLLQSP